MTPIIDTQIDVASQLGKRPACIPIGGLAIGPIGTRLPDDFFLRDGETLLIGFTYSAGVGRLTIHKGKPRLIEVHERIGSSA